MDAMELPTEKPPIGVRLSGISKRYGGAIALDGVSVTIQPGEIHALVGENGAGKSTLGKIIAGDVLADDGEIEVGGHKVSFRSPRDAIREGIGLIHQELSLVPGMSIIDNIFLGVEHSRSGFLDRRSQRVRYGELVDRIGLAHPPQTLVERLRVADQQKIEILRALVRNARIIVMDEPTAALTGQETKALLALMRDLKKQGVTIVFVSHFLEDVLEICDTVTVLKDGQHIKTTPTENETVDSLVTAMLGRKLNVVFPPKAPPPLDSPVILSVRQLSRKSVFEDISFDLRKGEILGLAGLVGAGRTEVARAVFGADPSVGKVVLDGQEIPRGSMRASIRSGLAMLPESRKDQGLIMLSSVLANTSLAHLSQMSRGGFIARALERRATENVLARVDTRVSSIEMPVSGLSGGNQQKVAIAKWLIETPKVLIVDEPTRGIDIGAKRTIYDLIRQLADDGLGVLLISSEMDEMLGLAHRILVLRNGRLVSELDSKAATEEAVMRAAFGETVTQEVA